MAVAINVPDRVAITDVTLREFGQNVPRDYLHLFSPEIRAAIALDLIRAGFLSLEVLSCVNPRVSPAMNRGDLRRVTESLGRPEGVNIITLVPNLAGYRTFLSLGLGPDGYNHTMGVFFSAVEAHNRANLGRSIDETVEEYVPVIVDASRRGIRMVAYVSAAFGYADPEKGGFIGADPGAVNRWMDLFLDLGARTVTLSDLQGVADEKKTVEMVESILELRKGRDMDRIGYHPHHLLEEQALANSMALFELGIGRFDASLGGTGGCVTGAPGNQPTGKLVRNFHKKWVKTGVDEDAVIALEERVQRILYSRIPHPSPHSHSQS